MPCNPSLMAMNPDDFCQDASRGLQLRELRRRLGWTQKELAEVCGVSRTSVVRWERDRYQVPKSVMVLLYLACICQELGDDFALWPIKLLIWTDRERSWWRHSPPPRPRTACAASRGLARHPPKAGEPLATLAGPAAARAVHMGAAWLPAACGHKPGGRRWAGRALLGKNPAPHGSNVTDPIPRSHT